MAERRLLYYITDRSQFPGDPTAQRRRLLQKVAEAARCGVDFIQLREKDLSAGELERLAQEAVATVREVPPELEAGNQKLETRFLINSRTDVAFAVGADGVHLRSDDVSVATVRAAWNVAGTRNQKLGTGNFVVSVSCHSEKDVIAAAGAGADFAVFAPVFEKSGAPGAHPAGLEALHRACQHNIPVLALGGVTLDNAQSCLEVGAAGIAGIRLFQENAIAEVVRRVRG
jgi:thiamine-phosphate pyrophosphorylase